MKEKILMLWDKGSMKPGQRIPIIKHVGGSTQFEDLIITEALIKRLRVEMRLQRS